MNFPKRSKRLGVGKEIGGAIYLHRDYETLLEELVAKAKLALPSDLEYAIVKHNLKNNAISFIECADFDTADEPIVGNSIIVHSDGKTRKRKQAADPEIYHHKWMFVKDDYRGFDVEQSKSRSKLWIDLPGLEKRKIGKKSYWEANVLPLLRVPSSDMEAVDADQGDNSEGDQEPTQIARHKTAIRRASFSKPLKCLLRDGLLNDQKDYFDYGCGHGRDLNLLSNIGIECSGWDPAYRPDADRKKAKVVNIGYVINVIEELNERREALRLAWDLASEVLCVAAQIEFAAPDKEQQVFGDGYLTSRGTFQKYYNQHELREYLQSVIGTDAISAAPGIFYLFKCEEAKQQFFASRYQRRYTVPRRKISEVLFEENKEILEPFMERLTELGRIPLPEEYPRSAELIEKFGSVKRAFKLVQKVTDESPWEEIAQKRSEDLLVYLALTRFGKRPPLSKLPVSVRRDLKEFLGGYKVACARADTLLFRVGDADAIDEACQRANFGQLAENALIIHRSCLEHLEPLLRIYEGCARALVGELDDANVIKLHRYSGKVSYISYANFEKDPFPVLVDRMKLSLRSLNIDWFDYSDWGDPYVLVDKQQLVPEFYTRKKLFESLRKMLLSNGLSRDGESQVRREEIHSRIANSRFLIKGHKLERMKN